jgi:hypothetical protein
VSTRTSVIEINGNRYDAATGQIISTVKRASQKSSQVIDGFIRRPQKSAAKSVTKRTAVKSQPRHQVKSIEFHTRAQKAQTLMRGGLKKPAEQLQSRLMRSSEPRLETQLRAKTTPKNMQVKRFGNPIKSSKFSQPFRASKQSLRGEVINPGRPSAATDNTVAAPLPSMITSVSHQKLERLLDEALTQADSHKEALRYYAARHFWQRRWFSGPKRWILISALPLIILGGLVFAWKTVPQFSVKIAGLRAHISPVVPSYKPDGYAIASPAKAASGLVSISYQSTIDPAQNYEITQGQSNLTSTSIAQSVVPKGAAVQTSQVQGNTVYIYGSHNDAAWVNNGVLYTIKDKASLNSDQLIKIVQGLNP